MGAEFRLEITPPLSALDTSCDAVFAATEWQGIPTSLVDMPNGVGVQFGATPTDPSWPHVADLCCNPDGSVYAVAHCANGVQFLHALVAHLESTGHSINLDEDYY